jgi:hypothetical protein
MPAASVSFPCGGDVANSIRSPEEVRKGSV